jgi:DNA-directed RNA polymerase III subunit RPC1
MHIYVCINSCFSILNFNKILSTGRTPATHGVIDLRLGVSDKVSSCKTCNKKMSDCSGHFGYISLELPVFHAGFMKHTIVILQCICKRCARLLLPLNERLTYLKRLKNSKTDALLKSGMFKKVVEMCKKNTICPHCGFSNGTIKKVTGTFKLIHEWYRAKKPDYVEHQNGYDEIMRNHPDLKVAADKPTENVNPVVAYELFSRMTDEDISLLWMQEKFCRPESLIFWTLPVPPVPIRPSVPQDQGTSNEDDLTIKLQEIVEINNALRLALENGATMKMVAEDWEFLQVLVALFINGDTPGVSRQIIGPRNPRGVCQRLKGKQGRFRGNLSGKRVDFSGRTVISPDPNLRVDQVGIPVLVAKVMTYPERAHAANLARLRKMIINGPEVHPGATIVRKLNGDLISLHYGNREEVAASLRVGDGVDRHMCDDDLVLFNRQPSLHKMSIMCHRVKVYPWRTFRFNECACTPYNADFDGDEMNIHLPQTEEARAEAKELMATTHNLITSRHGVPLIAATQDFLMGAHLLTHKDTFLTRENFCRMVSYLSDATEHIDMPPPAIWKPRKMWTGKQVISLLVRPNKQNVSFVNLEAEEKFYDSKEKAYHFCRNDGYVCFRNGELISGSLGKKTLGGDSKSSLYYVLIRDFGPEDAIRCMTRLSKMTSRFLMDRGCTIGVDDVTPSKSVTDLKENIVKEGMLAADKIIELFHSGGIKLRPGCNALQSLEEELNGILGQIRQTCEKAALETLHVRNSPMTMTNCGSKGSPLNIIQMLGCLGQVNVSGERILDGFVGRSLPHFPVGGLTPAAKGFCVNSFFSGLTATEFFYHTMGGREGLVDTAVKTAETGYMARRMMKALEDLSMQYDKTVRNSESHVVQFVYGDDGLNPQMMETGDRPVDFNRVFNNVSFSGKYRNDESMMSHELYALAEEVIKNHQFTVLLPAGKKFVDEVESFFKKKAMDLKELEDKENDELKKNGITQLIGSVKLDSYVTIRSNLRLMSAADKAAWMSRATVVGSYEYRSLQKVLRMNVLLITPPMVYDIVAIALQKYWKGIMEPGEAVGAVGAQSLSEPGTQMTLKTFHFAGVKSMNVTLGVPRLKEIINASKLISTPIIEAKLCVTDSLYIARIAKALIEKTTLGEVCMYIKEVHSPKMSYVSIKLDTPLIRSLQIDLNAHIVKRAILKTTVGLSARPAVLRALKDKDIEVVSYDKLQIYPPEMKDSAKDGIGPGQKTMFITQALKNALPKVIVQGISTVQRAIINEDMEDRRTAMGTIEKVKSYSLLVEGYGLRDVMACPGVEGTQTKTNHVVEMQMALGIEATRSTIVEEIMYIMKSYAISVDRRHLLLLSDVMTFKGEVLGITRFGVAKMKESVLMLASFEKTTDHLFDAAVHSREDSIVGVSECIIMGVPIPLGTGLFKLLHKAKTPFVVPEPKRTILESLADA